jgi:hypothetical protein
MLKFNGRLAYKYKEYKDMEFVCQYFVIIGVLGQKKKAGSLLTLSLSP